MLCYCRCTVLEVSINACDADIHKCYNILTLPFSVLHAVVWIRLAGSSRHAKLPHHHHVQPEQRTVKEPLSKNIQQLCWSEAALQALS